MSSDFQECATCDAKPGTPLLCGGCYHNRTLIHDLLGRIESYRVMSEKLQGHLDTARAEVERLQAERGKVGKKVCSEVATFRKSFSAAMDHRGAKIAKLSEENERLRDCLATGAVDFMRYRRRAMRLVRKLRRRASERLQRETRRLRKRIDDATVQLCEEWLAIDARPERGAVAMSSDAYAIIRAWQERRTRPSKHSDKVSVPVTADDVLDALATESFLSVVEAWTDCCDLCPFLHEETIEGLPHLYWGCGHPSRWDVEGTTTSHPAPTKLERADHAVPRKDGTPPEWCPLRSAPTIVRLTERTGDG